MYRLRKRLQSIFVLLVSLNLLPAWAGLVSLLISIKDVLLNVGKLFINLKKNRKHMKTRIIQFISKAKGVWNTVGKICGLKQTHFIEQENLKYGAVVFHTPPPDINYYNIY